MFVVVCKVQNAPSKKNAETRVCMNVYQKNPTLREVYGMSLSCFIRLSLGEVREELMRCFSSKLLAYLGEFDFLEMM